jgi:hypothetical protein
MSRRRVPGMIEPCLRGLARTRHTSDTQKGWIGMYNQLPMQVSLMERDREIKALLREGEILRALDQRPAKSVRLPSWAAARCRIAALRSLPAPRTAGVDCQRVLGSTATA